MKKYWHVTGVENFPSIIKEGIRLNEDGQIFIFDKKEFALTIAINQLGLINYALFEVKNLDKLRLKPDLVGEWTKESHKIYDHPIGAWDCKFINCYKIQDLK